MWIGTSSGLLTFAGTSLVAVDAPFNLASTSVLSMAAVRPPGHDADELWVGTDGEGLLKLANGRWSQMLPPDSVGPMHGSRCILSCVEEEGALSGVWIGTGNAGLLRIRDGAWTKFDRSSGLPQNDVRWMLRTADPEGRQALWVATNGGGLARFDGERFEVFSPADGLPNGLVRGLHEQRLADGRRLLWVGTYGGVAIIDLTDPSRSWTVLSDATSPALPDNTIYQVREDRSGRIYLFTNKGVARLSVATAGPEAPPSFAVETFTTEHGLPSSECNGGAAFVDSLGRVWAGTVGGAAVLDPSAVVADATPKPLHIESVYVGGTARPLADGAELRYDENSVEFRFALLSFVREEGTVYSTQLVGFDPQASPWVEHGHRNYTNLGKGDYTFVVSGRDAAGNVSGPVRLSFTVLPAPWHTWWSYTLYAVAAVAAVATALALRTRRLERRGRELERIVAERTTELATTIAQLRDSEQQAQDAREEAMQASQAKSVFLANMSHELRTPLNAVIGFAQLMERDARIPADQREHLEIIHESGEHLLGLINDVLSLSKVEAGKLALNPAPFRLSKLLDLVREMVRPRCEAKGLTLEFDVDGAPAAVLGDEGKLRQVLLNLLGNAVKFTESGGIVLRARWADGRAAVEVEDTGPGIAAEEMERLFRPFDQTETGRRAAEGSGLGLVISREIVRLMGGDITTRSEVGRGTTFRFEVDLPACDEQQEAAPPRAVALSPGQRSPRVLVVDDTPGNRLLVVRLLDLVGIECREASNGRDAVALFASWRPDLIFMDLRMPIMDGREAMRSIRDIERRADPSAPPVKIVAMTASVFESERDAVLADGADDLVFKPFSQNTVFTKLAEQLALSFEYETPAADSPPPGELTAARLAALPAPLRKRLAHALEVGDYEEALVVVGEVEQVDPLLERGLRDAVRQYRAEEVLAALEEVV
jgi:two-component system sensor histidine kinase/response regulator